MLKSEPDLMHEIQNYVINQTYLKEKKNIIPSLVSKYIVNRSINLLLKAAL